MHCKPPSTPPPPPSQVLKIQHHAIHIDSRKSPYVGTDIARVMVPDRNVPWQVRQTDRQTEIQTEIQTDRDTDRQTEIQTDRQTDRQRYRQKAITY